ncbi:uncharacterized protein LOC135399042 isoform X2 [Ornithodoros turicata]|uniref:uncharacterized protein LOC135399042 isoform X2 n=1 Tax=Ornithodoros turicata TaxID=34597 RepID=UPI0031396E7A
MRVRVTLRHRRGLSPSSLDGAVWGRQRWGPVGRPHERRELVGPTPDRFWSFVLATRICFDALRAWFPGQPLGYHAYVKKVHGVRSHVGWRVSRCYQYDDIKKCEASFVGGGKGLVASDACRLFIAYRTCVKDVVSRRCSREDEQQLPSYLIDRARELSWQCGGTVSEARDIHSVYRASGPAAYAPYTQGYPRATVSPGVPRYHNFSFVDSPSYAYTPPPAPVRSRDDSYCMVRASDALQECSRDHQRRQYNARKYYSDDRVREMCCATVEYRECIKLVLHDKCRDAGSSVVDSIIYQQTRELDYECRDFNAYRCAGCAVHVAKTTILLCLLAVFSKFYPRS